jgi:Cu/Ag efflux protein CusF
MDTVDTGTVKKAALLSALALMAACQHAPEPAKAKLHYPLSGKVVALDTQHRVATVDAAAIPNYMEAMTMDYPVSSASDFEKLHKGDHIRAMLDVTQDNQYSLSDVKIVPPNTK